MSSLVTENPTLEDQMAQARQLLERYWGYRDFRPLQAEAVSAVLEGHDSVVVLPTGGGKSLCYQLPALVMDGLAIVISPLISLMKDQVDSLRANGIAAACLNSSVAPEERRELAGAIRRGELTLLYVTPERMVMDGFLDFLSGVPLAFIAIDEAHCISTWGHDFRPEYRELIVLKERFPGVGIHAYTATANERVRGEIAEQLAHAAPRMMIGDFHRPNLFYSVERREGLKQQVLAAVKRQAGASAIVYCISRKKCEELSEFLNSAGIKALPYHAGLDDFTRHRHQDDFINDRVQVIAATVAFGMGIDKPDVRLVYHAGMPRSLEHYQQESGRAGRDGLEAECILNFSPQDFIIWERLLEDSAPEVLPVAMKKLREMRRFCTVHVCRHGELVGYFGQELGKENCGACDICLGMRAPLESEVSQRYAQQILSCVVRLKERATPSHTVAVLCAKLNGSESEAVDRELSTHGLMQEHAPHAVREWLEALAARGYATAEEERLLVTDQGWRVLRGEHCPVLYGDELKVTAPPARRSRVAAAAELSSMPAAQLKLLDALKARRKELAEARGVPAYVIFGDASLRQMAQFKPRDRAEFRHVHGVGEKKAADYAEAFLAVIRKFA